MAEKEEFFVLLNEVVVNVKESEGLFICGDFNGHVGEKADGFEGFMVEMGLVAGTLR